MHIVTKVFVVIASLLAVMLSTLATAYAVNADRLRTEYESERAKRMAAVQGAASELQRFDDLLRARDVQMERLNAQLNEARQQRVDVEAERDALKLQLAQAQQAADSNRGQIGALTAATNTLTTLTQEFGEELRQLRDSELESRAQRVRDQDVISDLQGQLVALEQSNRALQEQLVAAQQAVEQAAAGAAAGGASEGGPIELAQRITGTVQEVRIESETNQRLVVMNLGTRDQLRENVLLHVLRDDQYLGSVVVTRADLQASLGVVRFGPRTGEIRAGDTVVSRASAG